jgi:glyoxylase-like metal-dependent hydrolase (beta-lactamase superfamily II)
MTKTRHQDEWTTAELKRYLDRREKLFVLDVRNHDEYKTWKIESAGQLPTLNIPYFEMLEQGGKDDIVDSVVAYAEQSLVRALPNDKPVAVVCAKGGTSALVAEGLRKLGYSAINLQGGMNAWGDFYEFKAVIESQVLSVYQVSRPARGCLSYVIVSHGTAMVIDPLRHIQKYLDFAREKGFSIKLVLDTHGHADHISGGRTLADKVEAPYYLHPYDGIHPLDVLPAQIYYDFLRDGQEFSLGNSKMKTLHIPGHTLGNVAFSLDEKYLFTGDSIFMESIARPDLGGHGETWAPLHYRSLQKLSRLSESVMVLPGHFSSPREANAQGLYGERLGELYKKNEGLRMVQKGEREFVSYILSSLPTFPPQYVEIKRVNAGLILSDEEKASELELGKNICALAQVHTA